MYVVPFPLYIDTDYSMSFNTLSAGNDMVEVTVRPARVEGASLSVLIIIIRTRELLLAAELNLAFINNTI